MDSLRNRLTIAVVAGIPIAIHPSWLIVFGLVTWSLAVGYFPPEHPGWTSAAYWIAGAVSSLLLFASVLVHELGHSLVARRNGIPIRSITLFVFGGVAQIGHEARSPGAELRVAIAGPVTSLALALAFGAASLLARPVEMVAASALWLARINAMVALFNLIPGFPLDGGRVLRALVWRWTGSFRRASRIAAGAGQLVGLGLVGLGVLTALRGNVVAGLWTALIGWFLQNAAATSHAEADLRQMLSGVTVSSAMTRECARIGPDVTLDRLVEEEVLGRGRRCFLVVEGDRLCGLLTLHEVRSVPREQWTKISAEAVMAPLSTLASVGPADPLLVALEKLDDTHVAQLPVVEGDRLVGLVDREHIVHYIRSRGELGV
jgi:Zn-dependent protease/CBS domain-containing protein